MRREPDFERGLADKSDKSLLQVSKSPTQLSLAFCSVSRACLVVVSSLLHEVSWLLRSSVFHSGHSLHSSHSLQLQAGHSSPSLHIGHVGQLCAGHAGHSSPSLHVGHVGQLGAGHSSPSLQVGHC